MVKFRIQNKLMYTLLVILTIVVIAIGINAYGTNPPNPSTMGHTFEELTPPTGCASNQVVQWTGTTWACVTPSSGDINGVNTAVGSGLSGGASSGEVNLALTNPIKTCPAGQAINSFNLGASTNPTCVSGGGALSTTYSYGQNGELDIGAHHHCFITGVTRTASTGTFQCRVYLSAGTWKLVASTSTDCDAMCIN